MKYKIYSRYDTLAKMLGPIIIQVNDECAKRYYNEQDSFMKANYNIEKNDNENIIVCLGEYETQGIENKDMSKRYYLNNPITLYNEVYDINNRPPELDKKIKEGEQNV